MPNARLLFMLSLSLVLYFIQTTPPLPIIPSAFVTTIEANIVEKNYTSSYKQYYDYNNLRARLDFYEDNGTLLTELFFSNNGIHFSFDSYQQVCAANVLTDMKYQLMFYSNGTFKTVTDLFSFGPSYNPVYLGTSTVRGIQCDVWRTILNHDPSTGIANYTSDYYFTVQGWNLLDEEESQVPIMMHLQGTQTASNGSIIRVVDHYYHYVQFETGIEDLSVWNIPDFCPVSYAPIPYPQLPTRFRTGVSISFNHRNSTFGMQQYYDGNKGLFRVDYNNNDRRVEQIWDINNKLHWIIDKQDRTCQTANISLEVRPSWGLASLITDSGLFTPQQLFTFGEEFGETYRGQEVVRGILCNRWDASFNRSWTTSTGSTVNLSYILTSYFSVPQWKYTENSQQSQVPVRSITRSTLVATAQGTLEADQRNIEMIRDYTDFSVIVADDAFNAQSYCYNNLNSQPLPYEPQSYASIIELTDLNQKSSVTLYEYWDYENNRGRIDRRVDVDSVVTIFLDGTDGLMFYYFSSDGTCIMTLLDSSYLNPSGRLQGLSDQINFGPKFNETYHGKTMVRGRNADFWQSISNSTFNINGSSPSSLPVTSNQYFSQPDASGNRVPLRAVMYTNPTSIYYVDAEFVLYSPGSPDPSVFTMPASCLVYVSARRNGNARDKFRDVLPRSMRQGYSPDYSGYLQSGIAAVIGIFSALGGIIIGLVIGFVVCWFLFVKTIQTRKSARAAPPVPVFINADNNL